MYTNDAKVCLVLQVYFSLYTYRIFYALASCPRQNPWLLCCARACAIIERLVCNVGCFVGGAVVILEWDMCVEIWNKHTPESWRWHRLQHITCYCIRRKLASFSWRNGSCVRTYTGGLCGHEWIIHTHTYRFPPRTSIEQRAVVHLLDRSLSLSLSLWHVTPGGQAFLQQSICVPFVFV